MPWFVTLFIISATIILILNIITLVIDVIDNNWTID